MMTPRLRLLSRQKKKNSLMKQIYQGILFVAFLILAMAVGGSEGEGFILMLGAMIGVFMLMIKSGMIARPLTKEEVEKYYYGKKKA